VVFVEKGGAVMEDVMSLEGPVLKVNGELVLFIPLSAGGEELIELSRGISEVEGEFLKINIPVWLAAVLRIEEGDLVCVRKAGGMFRIGVAEPRQVH
jgi:hypothetical protein